jgi:hypothetical protein
MSTDSTSSLINRSDTLIIYNFVIFELMFRRIQYVVLAFCLAHSGVVMAHPVHATILNMQYNEAEKRFELIFRINKEDLQLAIFHNYETEAIAASDDTVKVYTLEKRYIRNMFKVAVNDTSKDDSLVFQQKVNDSSWTWVYLNIPVPDTPMILKMENRLMLDLFFDQENLVICSYKGKEYSWALNYEKAGFDITFD